MRREIKKKWKQQEENKGGGGEGKKGDEEEESTMLEKSQYSTLIEWKTVWCGSETQEITDPEWIT